MSEPVMYCSFCRKSEHEVRALIAGPDVLICDECVAVVTRFFVIRVRLDVGCAHSYESPIAGASRSVCPRYNTHQTILPIPSPQPWRVPSSRRLRDHLRVPSLRDQAKAHRGVLSDKI